MVFIATILSVAEFIAVASFQSRSPSLRPPSPKGVNQSIPINHNPPSTFDWSRSYTTKSENHAEGTEQVPTLSIQSLLEAGRLDDAVAELKNHGGEVPASTYHAVIEACCAGGLEPKRQKKNSKDDRIELAAELLQSMDDIVTAHAHEIIISGYARRGRWQDASRTLSSMEEVLGSSDDTKNNKAVYQTVLVALANANQFKQMNSLLTGMRRRGVKPTVYTYNSLLKICASDKVPRWKEALALLSQCQREPGVNPDLITFTTTMRACARGRQAGKAMELFRVVKDMGMKLDVYCYTTAMDACAKGKRWRRAMSLLDEMKEEGIAPNEVTYGVAVTACGNGGKWERALELLDQMRADKLKINTITYNSAIAALSTAARTESKQRTAGGDSDPDVFWKKALDLIKCMESEGVRRDSFTFSSAISTCGAAGRWEEAVDLIRAMKGDRIKPNKVAYTSAISACASSRKWEPAFDLFNNMKSDAIQPDIVAYNALIGAGMAAEKPVEVHDLWLEMCQPSNEKVSPDIVTLTEVIATLDSAPGKANRERVDKVFAEAVARGLVMRKDSLDTSWEVDLSRLSFPIARAACRFIFRQIVKSSAENEDGEVKDLRLITGASKMREYIREVLRDELKPSVYCVVPKMEQGTLQVKEKVMRNYIDGQQ
eukprot:CAMPEP_0172311378 /NCGR_PEP_ID=MMETSP1058-20130122/14636_1 /TAXON_ID=83371 /ORGANISM="Detonula confervacea, Strain CCMP 353" /LENGTH=656 /DNA_ID=CAMNT_0013024537 /DNA_START=111 /DNA_END=2081 /DNA_ORIENTATION=-